MSISPDKMTHSAFEIIADSSSLVLPDENVKNYHAFSMAKLMTKLIYQKTIREICTSPILISKRHNYKSFLPKNIRGKIDFRDAVKCMRIKNSKVGTRN